MKQEEKQETMRKKAAKEYGLKNIDIKAAEKNVFKFFTADKSITYFCHNNGVIDVTERARRGHKADAETVSKAEPKKAAAKPIPVKKAAKAVPSKTRKAAGKGSAKVSKAPKPAKASKTAAKKTTEGKTVAKIPRVRTKTSDISDIKTVRTVKVKPKADARNAEKTVIVKDADDDDKLYETSAPKTKYNFKRGQCVKDVYGGKEYTVLSVTKGPGSLARLVENSTGFDCTVAVADLVPGKGKPRQIEE